MPQRGVKSAVLIGLAVLLVLGLLFVRLSEPDSGRRPTPTESEPTRFDYYVLVLGWSPTYCATEGKDGQDPQCGSGNAHSLILHGLWPAYARGWPQDCQTGQRSWVPQPVIDDMADIMPSKSLIIHEYRTHGTCSGLSPERYFKVARDLYRRIAIPPRFAAAVRAQSLSPREIEGEFVASNAWLKPGMIEVTCRRRQLLDVRVCFDRDLSPRDCGQNEARRACHAASVMLSPQRAR